MIHPSNSDESNDFSQIDSAVPSNTAVKKNSNANLDSESLEEFHCELQKCERYQLLKYLAHAELNASQLFDELDQE